MRAKLFVALCWIWGAIIVGIGVNLVSSYIQDSFISFLIHYRVWVAAGFVGITGLTLWTWKDYRFAEAVKQFELFKEARELLPIDLDFQEGPFNEHTDLGSRPYNKTYISRRAIPLDADPDIEPGYEKSLAAHDRATTLQPDHANAWTNKGICLKAMGRDEEALAACRRVVELDPPNPKLWRAIARTAEACGDRIVVEKATLRALELEREQENASQGRSAKTWQTKTG